MRKRVVKKKLGEILIDWNIINHEQFRQVEEMQRAEFNRMLSGEILVELKIAREEDVTRALIAQYNLPYISVDDYDISKEVLGLVPGEICERNMLMPLDRFNHTLVIAMSNPLDTQAIEEVRAISGCSVQTFIATASGIERNIKKYYAAGKNEAAVPA
ncbi:MAG: hypothetical protein JW844_05255 [Candidatus Omnitrophica bacterium]|nr:hypothetical protein [Candidatus Omnitrophota bacterium]